MVTDLNSNNDVANYAIIAELISDAKTAGIIGGYCEEGFPFYCANQNMASMLGYESVAELREGIGNRVANTIHPDDLPRVDADLGENYYEGLAYETMYRMPRKDGSWVWTIDRGRVIRAEDGRLAIVSMVTDISNFMQRYDDMERQNRWSNAALNNMPGGYHRCAAKPGFPFQYVSERFTAILGWTREELRERFDDKYVNLLTSEDASVFDALFAEDGSLPENGRYFEGIYELQGKNGPRWVMDSTKFVDDGVTEPFFQGAISDITDFVLAEQARRENLEDDLHTARSESVSQANFLMNVSHDIRTPLNAMLGLNALARRACSQPQVSDYLAKSRSAGMQLLDVINDVLDMGRIQNGMMELNDGVIDVKEHISTTRAMFDEMCSSKGITFMVEDGSSVPYLRGDGKRVSQILTNLLANAVKFTETGGTITYSIAETANPELECATYHVHVKDTGIGMSQDFQKEMWSLFTRENTRTVSETQGTGLGLSIAKSLTNMMGGSLTCESELGCGSDFLFECTFPISEAPASQRTDDGTFDAPIFADKRMLLVDDNDLNREISAAMLEMLNVEVEQVCNGRQAVEAVQNAEPGYFDAVLMDIQMPIMNGYDATRAIRALPGKRGRQVVVAMTANAFEEHRKQSLEAGMDAHLAKPIEPKQLVQVLAEIWEQRASEK